MKSFLVLLGSIAVLSPFSIAFAEGTSSENFRLLKSYIQSTAEQNFSSQVSAKVSVNTPGDKYSPSLSVQEVFEIQGNKIGKRFSFDINENVSFALKNAEQKNAYTSNLFPIVGTSDIKSSIILDFDAMRFQGKVSTINLHLDDSSSASGKKIAEGFAEFYDFVSEKWVEINIGDLAKEYPKEFPDYEQMKQEIKDVIEQKQFIEFLQNLVDQGVIVIDRSGEVFTVSIPIEFTKNTPVVFEGSAIVLQFTVSNGIVSKFSFQNSLSVEKMDIALSLEAKITPNAGFVHFAELAPSDISLTKIARMFLEFSSEQERKYGSDYNSYDASEYEWQYAFRDIIEYKGFQYQRSLTRKERTDLIKLTKEKYLKEALGYLFTSGKKTELEAYLKGKSLDQKLSPEEIVSLVKLFKSITPEEEQMFMNSYSGYVDRYYIEGLLLGDKRGYSSFYYPPYGFSYGEFSGSLGEVINVIARVLNAEEITNKQFGL